jgi:hypothetical protein
MGKTYLPLSDNPDKVVTIKGQKDEKQIPSGTWTTSYQPHDDSRSNDDISISTPYQRNSSVGNYDMNNRKSSDFDRNNNESSERKSASHSYPYPYPSPYSDSRNSNAHSSQPSSQYDSKYLPNYPQRTESDVLSQRNGYTYQSPFRDLTITSREGK